MARAALFAATLAVAVALASASGPATWYDCTPAGAIGNVTGVTINPNPPAVGVTTTVTGTGTLTGTVPTGSKFSVSMYYSNIRLLVKSGSVCEDSTISLPLGLGTVYVQGLNCPVSAGSLTLTEKADIAKTPPPGNYKIQLEATDPSGSEIVCVGITWDA